MVPHPENRRILWSPCALTIIARADERLVILVMSYDCEFGNVYFPTNCTHENYRLTCDLLRTSRTM